MRRAIVVACILSGIGLLGLAVIAFGSQGIREHVKSNYKFVGTEAIPNDNDKALVYTSTKPPSKTAADIIDAVKPGDKLVTDAGVFLRYKDDIVAITPQSGGGSQIQVEDEDSGYRHHFLYVGGWWGTYSGRGEGFRGGGPGAGK